VRILIFAWYFPPANTMGALRIGKLAKYLHGAGHDIRVVCAKDVPFPQTLPVEIPAELIHYTKWLDVNGLPRAVTRLRNRLRGTGDAAAGRPALTPPAAALQARSGGGGLLRGASRLYTSLLNRPDSQIGWLPYAVAAGKRILAHWRPDMIFASAPPFTVLLAGGHLARRFGIPWIAEYRDRWVEDPYTEQSSFGRWVDTRFENIVVRDVAGIVTVSEPWAADYRRRFGRPVEVVYNGFDPNDFPAELPAPDRDAERLEILYAGTIYPDRRDPTPLFRALKLLGPDARHVRISFYGPTPDLVQAIVAREGVAPFVAIHGSVTYARSLALQAAADVLLLMQWNDPKEAGNVPGKLFEYLAARRPILGLGLTTGVPARFLRERQAGVLLNDPAAIAEQLRRWIAEKRAAGSIALLPSSVRDGLSRSEQFARLASFVGGLSPK